MLEGCKLECGSLILLLVLCVDLLVSRTKNNEGVKKEKIMIVRHEEHSGKIC